MIHQKYAEIGKIIDIEELTQRRAVAPTGHKRCPRLLCLMKAPNQRGENMTVLRMVVVIGTIEIRRHHGDIVRAVLSIQIGTVFQSRNLRKSIRLIRLLERRLQQAVLLHRLLCETRVDAGGAKELQLFAVISPCGMNDVHLQHHILVHKICRSLGVRLNPADLCSSQKNVLRFFCCKKSIDIILSAKIKLRVGTRHNTRKALTFQLAANR